MRWWLSVGVGVWICGDLLAHAGNVVGVLTWVGVPFAYGSTAYELTAIGFWSVGLAMWAGHHAAVYAGD